MKKKRDDSDSREETQVFRPDADPRNAGWLHSGNKKRRKESARKRLRRIEKLGWRPPSR